MLEGKKTYIGLTVALLAGIANGFGIPVGEADQAAIVKLVVDGIAVAGLLVGYYGRWKAKRG